MSVKCQARKSTLFGLLFLGLCLAPVFADPIPAEVSPKAEASSVVTPQASAQLVASAKVEGDGLSPAAMGKVASKPGTTDEMKPEGGEEAVKPAEPSEVGDLMKDPYHNFTITSSDRDEVAVLNSEIDVVEDPHVKHINKTHEEEGQESNKSSESPTGSSTQQAGETASSAAPTTDGSTEQALPAVSSSRPPPEDSVYNTQDADAVEMLNTGKTEKEMEHMKTSEPDGEVSSPPVSALVSHHDTHDHPTTGKSSSLSHTTEAAAILGGVLVLVALAGYLGLLLWRRVLEKRYGNREMLVNEDDDLKHFEL